MNLPNIPTDNLFKFLSIFGLIILFTSIILPISEYKIVKSEVIRFRHESAQLNIKIDFLDQDAKTLLQITKDYYPDYPFDSINNLNDSILKYPSINIMIKYLLNLDSTDVKVNFIKRNLLEINEKLQEAQLASNELAYKEDMMHFNILFLRLITIAGISGTIIGITLIIFGFKKWFDFQVKADGQKE